MFRYRISRKKIDDEWKIYDSKTGETVAAFPITRQARAYVKERNKGENLNICIKCGVEKERKDFPFRGWSTNGTQQRRRTCKSCSKFRNFNLSYKWVKEHKKEVNAQGFLRRSVTNGKVSKPDHCEVCGVKAHIINGHHSNYDEPLKVTWVCHQCHKDLHRKRFPVCVY